MSSKIFVNLPVKDLAKSMEFFKKIGYTFNAQFTDETAAGMRISDTIYSMLLTEEKFKSFTPKSICDTSKSTEALLALSVDSREEVDAIIKKAADAGAKILGEPEDYGFMYSQAFEDLDGHSWNYFFMEPSHIEAESACMAAAQ